MKLFKKILRACYMTMITGAILLATCKPRTDETSRATSAFNATDISSVDSLPAIFRDTSEEFIRTRFTRVNRSFFEEEKKLHRDSTLTLQLFPDVAIRMSIQSVLQGPDQTEVWSLYPDEPLFGTGNIIICPSAVYARIQVDTIIYEVFPVGKDIVRIREIDQTKFPGETPPIENHSGKTQVIDTRKADENPVITVLLVAPTVYTVYCSMDSWRRSIETVFAANLNLVFNAVESTGVTAVVRFACTEYSPVGGDMKADMNWVSTSPEVAALRNLHKADMVCLVIPEADKCGYGIINYPIDSLDVNNCFSVIKESCALSNYTFAHELGHNMGMQHDRQTLGNFDSSTCNYGSIFKVRRASSPDYRMGRSIMSYPGACDNCVEFPLYSNPMTITYGDLVIGPMGVDCGTPPVMDKYMRANNRQQLINAAPIISRFR